MTGTFFINDKEQTFAYNGDELLLDTLRNYGYREVKRGCEEGECGACMVLLDGRPVNSCKIFTASVGGRKIHTVKSIGDMQHPHIIQQAFVESGAVQCGFCTPGLVLATHYLLQENPDPKEGEIKQALDGNLCRCTGYIKIIDAVKLAASRMKQTAD